MKLKRAGRASGRSQAGPHPPGGSSGVFAGRGARFIGWALAAPALVVIFVFFALPVAAGLLLSLTDFDLYALADLSSGLAEGVGFEPTVTCATAVFECASWRPDRWQWSADLR